MIKFLVNMRLRKTAFFSIIILALAGFWLMAPREPASLDIAFDDALLGDNMTAYLAAREARFDDIIPNLAKQIIWADAPQQKTPLSIIYIHGFSASAAEIRPVPDRLAATFGANLFYTRLRGHGRGSAAMNEATIAAWMHDMGEALAIGRRLGDKTIVIATSTGGTISAVAALDPMLSAHVKGYIFVSPNFGINNAFAGLLTWPLARHWVPLILGDTRQSTPRNALNARYWTTTYPTTAILPMAALVKAVMHADFSTVQTPALFYFSNQDQVVNPVNTIDIAKRWGGTATSITVTMGADDDVFSHVIAGDIVSPGQTEAATIAMQGWIKGLGE
ncbi:alpha/beta hydrolase [Alphaproteobacteria bacterium]|nr:alpha/beta hydrolase [Alphaproteobacteria bacterium]